VIELSLRQEEAKLAFLAIAYHLGRPGSELDPLTKQPVEHGLAEVARELQPQLRLAAARLTLRENQVERLLSGMLGSVTELKAIAMLRPGEAEPGMGRSTVPGFAGSLRHLFPEVEESPDAALEVAERMVMLKRQMDERLAVVPRAGPERPPARRRWWPFG
jgi:hypothetical protein